MYRVKDAYSNIVMVTITVSLNSPSGAQDIYFTKEDNSLFINRDRGVLINDNLNPNRIWSASITAEPRMGLIEFNSDGSFEYTPITNFYGTDSFTYQVSDRSVVGPITLVTIVITPVNDKPVASSDTYTTNEDTTLVVNSQQGVLSNDYDVDSKITAQLMTSPRWGTLLLFASDGGFVYVPRENSYGTDTFTYKVRISQIDTGKLMKLLGI